MPDACGGHKRVSDLLELEIHMAVSCPVDAGNQTQIPQKSSPRSLTLMMLALERQGTETSRLSLTLGYTAKPCLKKQNSWAKWCTPLISAFKGQREMNPCEFETAWYTASSRATERPSFRKTKSKQNKGQTRWLSG